MKDFLLSLRFTTPPMEMVSDKYITTEIFTYIQKHRYICEEFLRNSLLGCIENGCNRLSLLKFRFYIDINSSKT